MKRRTVLKLAALGGLSHGLEAQLVPSGGQIDASDVGRRRTGTPGSDPIDLIEWGGGKFLYGTYYYPDHWPEGMWEKDARMMQAAGINLVKTGEGAWVTLEPEEGRFDFAWLDRAIKVLDAHGIKVILGTPTYSPPAWLYAKYPDVGAVDQHGWRARFGTRATLNLHSSYYLEATRRVVTALAEHYRDNSTILGFSIDDEITGGGTPSYDPATQAAFREWCQRKYKTLENLNKSWGMVFWGLTLTSWDQLPMPWYTGGESHNPSMALDFSRFRNDSVRDFVALQADILKRVAPGKLITSNGMGLFDWVDDSHMYGSLDFVARDNGPTQYAADFDDYFPADLGSDLTRGAKNNQNFMVMEEQVGMGATDEYVQRLSPPQLVRVWSYDTIAHGADAICYYRWRQCPFGAEQLSVFILGWDSHAGDNYRVIAKMGNEMPKIAGLLRGSRVVSPAAVLYSPETRWAFQIQPHTKKIDYLRQMLLFYKPLRQARISVDVVFPQSDFSAYKVIAAPSLLVVDDVLAQKLDAFVKDGGILILSYLSGAKDRNNWATQLTLPGLLGPMAGIAIHDFDPEVPPVWAIKGAKAQSEQQMIEFEGSHFPANTWFEILEPTSASVLATYMKGFYAGKAAVTENLYGKGTVYYVGTEAGSDSFCQRLVSSVLKRAGIPSGPLVPAGIQVARREKPGTEIFFILNHTGVPQTVPMGHSYRNALTGGAEPSEIHVAAYDVKILMAP